MVQPIPLPPDTFGYEIRGQRDHVDHDEGYGDFTSSGHHDHQSTHECVGDLIQEAEPSTSLTNATQVNDKEDEIQSEVRILFLPRLDIMLFITDSAAVKHSCCF